MQFYTSTHLRSIFKKNFCKIFCQSVHFSLLYCPRWETWFAVMADGWKQVLQKKTPDMSQSTKNIYNTIKKVSKVQHVQKENKSVLLLNLQPEGRLSNSRSRGRLVQSDIDLACYQLGLWDTCYLAGHLYNAAQVVYVSDVHVTEPGKFCIYLLMKISCSL